MFLFISYFILITLYWVSMIKYIYSTKNKRQHRKGTIWNTGCEHWTGEQFEGQAGHWEIFCFVVGNLTVLLWLSWYGTATNQPYRDNYYLSRYVDRKPIVDISLKSTYFSLSILSFLLMIWGDRWVKVINIENSKCSISQL